VLSIREKTFHVSTRAQFFDAEHNHPKTDRPSRISGQKCPGDQLTARNTAAMASCSRLFPKEIPNRLLLPVLAKEEGCQQLCRNSEWGAKNAATYVERGYLRQFRVLDDLFKFEFLKFHLFSDKKKENDAGMWSLG
jgi:hypothetical protein